ncbi:MAG: MarC family protein [Desulfobacterales bacterium]
MEQVSTLFIQTFTTLLAIINPLEALPIFLKLMDGRDDREHLQVARRSCFYATLLLFFFLVFGTAMLKIFDVPLSMVRIVGGIVLLRIGFSLFLPSSNNEVIPVSGGAAREGNNVAFVPLAMPIMFGPGAIATVIGMSSLVRHPFSDFSPMAAITGAILAAMLVIYLILAYARKILRRIGPQGVDAATRIVGFFVSAMGMALIFHGIIEVMQQYGVITKP